MTNEGTRKMRPLQLVIWIFMFTKTGSDKLATKYMTKPRETDPKVA